MDIIKTIKSFGIVLGIVSLILGAVLVIRPTQSEEILNMAVGIGLVVMGGVKLLQEIFSKKEMEKSWLHMILPLLMMTLGIYTLVDSSMTMFTAGIIIGVFAFIMSIERFSTAKSRHKNDKPIKSTLVMGLIHIVFSGFLCYNAFAAVMTVTVLGGIYLVVNGIMIIASSIYFKDLQ